ncbi:hypothetical protein M231_02522 [Tremella mesenterica]|uniref:Uncharacterized protein n=1 Tax=Tremella mesenterica TaxID=5217 RepID=A0A4Q1BQN4_TREME|nr:uncharacterized protein TREMEDRAFT_64587 [Tremella mesenterica DSM 1558]EIW67335.1 hypothetical protein TREMEDRAFT_64587 [Tremella mesenterica DSM 1558]RXK40248.1 hypothetical protein M231_02522 [Tremella mesenterica]
MVFFPRRQSQLEPIPTTGEDSQYGVMSINSDWSTSSPPPPSDIPSNLPPHEPLSGLHPPNKPSTFISQEPSRTSVIRGDTSPELKWEDNIQDVEHGSGSGMDGGIKESSSFIKEKDGVEQTPISHRSSISSTSTESPDSPSTVMANFTPGPINKELLEFPGLSIPPIPRESSHMSSILMSEHSSHHHNLFPFSHQALNPQTKDSQHQTFESDHQTPESKNQTQESHGQISESTIAPKPIRVGETLRIMRHTISLESLPDLSPPSSPASLASLPSFAPSLSSLSRTSSPALHDVYDRISPSGREMGEMDLVLPTLHLPNASLHLSLPLWEGKVDGGLRVALVEMEGGSHVKYEKDATGKDVVRPTGVHGTTMTGLDGSDKEINQGLIEGLASSEVGNLDQIGKGERNESVEKEKKLNAGKRNDKTREVINLLKESEKVVQFWDQGRKEVGVVRDDKVVLRIMTGLTLDQAKTRVEATYHTLDQLLHPKPRLETMDKLEMLVEGYATKADWVHLVYILGDDQSDRVKALSHSVPTMSQTLDSPSFFHLPSSPQTHTVSPPDPTPRPSTVSPSINNPSGYFGPRPSTSTVVTQLISLIDHTPLVRSHSTASFLSWRPSLRPTQIRHMEASFTSESSRDVGIVPTLVHLGASGEWEATLSRRMAQRREADSSREIRGGKHVRGRPKVTKTERHKPCHPLFPPQSSSTESGLGWSRKIQDTFEGVRGWVGVSGKWGWVCAVVVVVGAGWWMRK